MSRLNDGTLWPTNYENWRWLMLVLVVPVKTSWYLNIRSGKYSFSRNRTIAQLYAIFNNKKRNADRFPPQQTNKIQIVKGKVAQSLSMYILFEASKCLFRYRLKTILHFYHHRSINLPQNFFIWVASKCVLFITKSRAIWFLSIC